MGGKNYQRAQERTMGRMLRENEKAMKAQQEDGQTPHKLSSEEARKRAAEVARKHDVRNGR